MTSTADTTRAQGAGRTGDVRWYRIDADHNNHGFPVGTVVHTYGILDSPTGSWNSLSWNSLTTRLDLWSSDVDRWEMPSAGGRTRNVNLDTVTALPVPDAAQAGDWVRVVADTCGHRCEVGTVHRVTRVDDAGPGTVHVPTAEYVGDEAYLLRADYVPLPREVDVVDGRAVLRDPAPQTPPAPVIPSGRQQGTPQWTNGLPIGTALRVTVDNLADHAGDSTDLAAGDVVYLVEDDYDDTPGVSTDRDADDGDAVYVEDRYLVLADTAPAATGQAAQVAQAVVWRHPTQEEHRCLEPGTALRVTADTTAHGFQVGETVRVVDFAPEDSVTRHGDVDRLVTTGDDWADTEERWEYRVRAWVAASEVEALLPPVGPAAEAATSAAPTPAGDAETRLAALWDALGQEAETRRWCDEYDRFAERHGGPVRPSRRTARGTATVTLTVTVPDVEHHAGQTPGEALRDMPRAEQERLVRAALEARRYTATVQG